MATGIAGIDGGGTRTRAVLVDDAGGAAGRAEVGGSNLQLAGLAGVERVLEELWPRLGVTRLPLRSLCLALAGAGRPPEQEAVGGLVRRRGWAERVLVVSDAVAALEGAHGGAAGVVAIAGTGSIVMGRNARGELARAGGWGPLLGDEGSGYAIALEGLRAVLRARDGCEAATVLADRLPPVLQLVDWDELVSRVYGGQLDREGIAALSPQVFAAARDGDAVAGRIVAAAGAALGRQVGAVAGRLGLGPEVAVACSGGVLSRERPALWPAMAAAASEMGTSALPRAPQLPPVLGAVLLAWRLAGMPVGPGLAEALARAFPDPS